MVETALGSVPPLARVSVKGSRENILLSARRYQHMAPVVSYDPDSSSCDQNGRRSSVLFCGVV